MPVALDYKKGFIYQEGRQEGHKEGRVEERFEMAVTMSMLGYSIDVISQVTKISIKELTDYFRKRK
jgi:predicted transposase YdaD